MSSSNYHRPPRDADIEARIYILRTEEGGRKTPVQTGYRPCHDFGLDGILNDAQHEYIGTETVGLGETANAYLRY
jgi:translation elongation factor EF-Tu-like GTPase